MSIEITDELTELIEEHRHYGTEATARHLAAYICDEMLEEDEEEWKFKVGLTTRKLANSYAMGGQK